MAPAGGEGSRSVAAPAVEEAVASAGAGAAGVAVGAPGCQNLVREIQGLGSRFWGPGDTILNGVVQRAAGITVKIRVARVTRELRLDDLN